MTTLRVAAVQAASSPFDLDRSLELAGRWTREAAAAGARVVVFPESFLPGYPAWVDYGQGVASWGEGWPAAAFERLHANALEVPGPACARLGELARSSGVTLVMGAHERAGRTLHNVLLVFGPDGALLNHHRKLVPTHGERLLWGAGDADGVRVVNPGGVMLGGLICWEHWMPPARHVLHEEGEQVHAALWPWVGEMHLVASRHHAFEGRCFVVAAGGILRASDLPKEIPLDVSPETMLLRGGSTVIGPDGALLAPPVMDRETLVVADCDLGAIVRESMTLDVAGHYARPDLFEWKVRRGRRAGSDAS